MSDRVVTSNATDFEARGYVLWRGMLSRELIDRVIMGMSDDSRATSRRRGASYAARNLLANVTEVRELARLRQVKDALQALTSSPMFAVGALFFDKIPEANWHVGWHQDVVIPVREKRDVAGFGPWSVKEGVHHVEPPAAVLDRMVIARFHLDDCDETNGPLRVAPGSHHLGLLPTERVLEAIKTDGESAVTAAAGDVLFMRPLLLHASSRALNPCHRRVIHIIFARDALPDGLAWADTV